MKKKILCVDDQRRYRNEVAAALKAISVELIFAEDGLDGLKKFRKELPDLVLLDAMLPKLHGFQLCKMIKSDKRKKIPVFILTGIFTDEKSCRDVIEKYGADEYLLKPFSRDILREKVEFYLSKQ